MENCIKKNVEGIDVSVIEKNQLSCILYVNVTSHFLN